MVIILTGNQTNCNFAGSARGQWRREPRRQKGWSVFATLLGVNDCIIATGNDRYLGFAARSTTPGIVPTQ